MCGFVGFYQTSPKARDDRAILQEMNDQIIHRGPNDSGQWLSEHGHCGLGHRRLSIIDLSQQAKQPMLNEKGDVAIVFNGEIYNHKALRAELSSQFDIQWKTSHSDTEVILRAYEYWGTKALARFYGMFSLAIYDERNPSKKLLHLVRDRIGIKPLYFTKTKNNEWVFGSEIKALMKHPDISADLNKTAFWHYLTFITTPAPFTLFDSIWKVPPATIITIENGTKTSHRKWWQCQPSAKELAQPASMSFEQASKQLNSLLKKSIERRMVSDVPFGVLLSGGVDSSLNVALMSELMDRPVTTFTIGYQGCEDSNEFQHAQKVAKRYKTQHHETLISEKDAIEFIPEMVYLQDEPIADNVCIPLYFIAKLVKESDTTVIQVGEGADENFLGYWWCDHYLNKYQQVYQQHYRPGLLQWLKKRFRPPPALDGSEDSQIRARALQNQALFWGGAVCWWGDMRDKLTPTAAAYSENIHCPVDGLLPASFTEQDSHAVVDYYYKSNPNKLAEPAILQQIPYLEHQIRLPEHLLMRVDKMTMAHSIEARVPFLDHEVVEFANQLPPEYKLSQGVGKKLLKKVAEPYLDHDIIYRKKQGFGAPMEHWFKQDNFAKRCRVVAERSPLIKEKLINKTYFMNLLNHQTAQGGGYSFHLWTVLNAMIWYDAWIEKREDCF